MEGSSNTNLGLDLNTIKDPDVSKNIVRANT